jgi:hypothetical protein
MWDNLPSFQQVLNYGILWVRCISSDTLSAKTDGRRASVEWAKVIKLLVVNRLVAPESELGVPNAGTQRPPWTWCWEPKTLWPPRSASTGHWTKRMEHKEALERHLAQRWQDLFEAECDLLRYDLTSTYFEG